MARRTGATKVKPMSIRVLLFGIVALILVSMLAQFGILDLSTFQSDIITLIAIAFVSVEVGITQLLRGKKAMRKFSGLQWFGMAVVAISFIGVITGLLGMEVALLENVKGIVNLALAIFVVIEIFN